MKKIMMSAAVLALLATGCQNEVLVEQSQPQEGQLFTLEVGRGFESRTVLSGNDTYWSEDDAIYVSGVNGKVNGELKFAGYGATKSIAKFSGYITGGEPSKLEHIVFPAPKDGIIDMSARTLGKLDAPMIGTIANGAVEDLFNVGGLLTFKVEGGKGNSYGLNAIDDNGNNMTGGYYQFDPSEGTLKYIPGNNVVTIQVNEDDCVFVPVATTTAPTTGDDNSTVLVDVEVINTINDGVIKETSSSIKVENGKVFGDDPTEDTSALEFPTISEDKADTKWYNSTKTEFEIFTDKQLVGFAKIVYEGADSFEGKTIKLMGDIDLSDNKWVPVGTSDRKFAGTFDGNGKTISNMTIEAEYAAFIAYTDNNASIKNITFENVNINSTKYAAGVVCNVGSNNTFESIEVSGKITATSYAAGVIFDAIGVKIKNCKNEADITSNRAGGIAAWLEGANVLEDVENTGDIIGNTGAGGITCRISGSIINAVNRGNIVANGTEPAGGIAQVQLSATTYKYCFNYGNVTTTADNANSSAAGILGHTPSSKATFNYCANNGTIIAEKAGAAGIGYGLYGNVNATYCYNAGTISAANYAGAISPKGHFSGDTTAKYCINYGTITGADKKVYLAASKNTDCYYLKGNKLYVVAGNEITTEAALQVLNGGENNDFFDIENGKIVVKK